MYGAFDKKTGIEYETDQEQLQQQQQQQPSQPQQIAPPDPNQSNVADVEAESRRRKRIYSHCHIQSIENDESKKRSVDKSARRRLIVASITCLVFMIAEAVGGVLSNSLAIATDAAHLLTDFASFMISLFAIWLSSRPATRKMSFGWYRAEVIGALLSVLMIWLVTGLLVYMAVERLRTGNIEIDSFVMVVTASAGLLVNILMAIALNADGHGHGHFHGHGHTHDHGSPGNHNHRHEINNHSHLDHLHEDDSSQSDDDNAGGEDARQRNHHYHSSVTIDCSMEQSLTTPADQFDGSQPHLDRKRSEKKLKKKRRGGGEVSGRGRSNINVRAAFIHVIGDFVQSLGVLIAALIIHFEPSYAIVDPICTFIFSFIVLITTINIIRDATNVLMEGIPDGINFIEVHEKLQSLPNVIRVHNLRIWSLSLDKIAISTHLVIDTTKTTSAQALKHAIETLKDSFNFFEVTIQIEEYREDMKDCEHCRDEDVVIDMVMDGNATSRMSSKTG